MLWETSVPVKHLIKKASPALLNFTKSTGSRAENVRKFFFFFFFVFGLGYMTISELLRAIQEKVLFDTFPESSE